MSTRSTYRVIETWKDDTGKTKEQTLCLMYVQMDGYPDGHPLETAEWLSTGKVVNGISMAEKAPLIFNGAGCLAAQLVAKHKDGVGGTYLHNIKHRGKCGEDYLYDIIVSFEDKSIKFRAYENGWDKHPTKLIFSGTPAEFVKKYTPVTAR